MKTIMRKLRSRNGASMILAMVFMLFCLFVGGSVLAAAAENGYRVEHLSDQQQYLDERSAALLICDQLNPEGSKPLKLTIYEIQTTIQPVYVMDGGVVEDIGDATVQKSVSIQAPANLNMTALQRIAVECAVWQYMKEAGMRMSDTVSVSFGNFVCGGSTVDSMTDFWYQYNLDGSDPICGSIDITGARDGGSDSIADFQAEFECSSGAELYDFTVNFGNLTQMTVVMDGYSGAKDPVTSSTITTYGGNYARITTESRQVAISWDEPVIQKGGA